MNRRIRGTGSIFKRNGIWWMAYSQDGVRVQESTGQTGKEAARVRLDIRIRQLQAGELDIHTRKVSVADLMEAALHDYEVNGKASLDDAKARWTLHLELFFRCAAARVTTDKVREYIANRQAEGAADATINRELALLKRAFNLGRQCSPPKVRLVPHIPMLREDNTRTGFLEQEQHDKMAAATAKHGLWLHGIFEAGYQLGWRVSELTSMRVRRVDLASRELRLDPGTTKNGEGRMAVMPEALYQLVKACCIGKKADAFLFSRDEAGSKPVRDFRGAWEIACKEAGCAGLLFHDLRRSAVRNMIARGIPQHVAMQITGHKTVNVFHRYAIVANGDLREAARRMEDANVFTKVEGDKQHLSNNLAIHSS
jgi:integrase